ncbi:phosphatase 2C-like domain-containing protein [Mycotypha africana]|uniref:phosphatase 2C-like domain-containing protein n=1 Tax=Mycotypha africana TaxID=64632 RepID=UPI0022FFF980|nr:phosphatase 2C-like domain-containing protein [Mycotypha africana]KAI8984493.1 phosphatase 2C-like domain-containing protein [Mycotypha africana]
MGQTLSEPITEKTTTHESNHKYFYGCSHMQGWRLTMEDAHTTLLKLGDTNASFFGVFDGHGGSTIAQYTGQTLYKKVLESQHFEKKEYAEALKDAFKSLDKSLLEDNNFAYDPSGCTAVAALITDDDHIFVANAGDSRGIISINGQVKPLSYDHKPTDPEEMQRIISAGGFVEFGRVNGNLALSRAIGDFEFKQNDSLPAEKQVVTCVPDIIDHQITEEDEFFVLACDGIWDCMSNQQVVDFIRDGIAEDKQLGTICEEIMDACLADDSTNTGLGYDNMSVMIIAILNGKQTEKDWYHWMKEKITSSREYQEKHPQGESGNATKGSAVTPPPAPASAADADAADADADADAAVVTTTPTTTSGNNNKRDKSDIDTDEDSSDDEKKKDAKEMKMDTDKAQE